jgi:spore coat protein U-like protein
MRKILLGLAAASTLLAMPAYAAVETKTTDLSVTATVVKSCAIASTSTLDFGQVKGNDADIDSTGSITFTCSDTTPYFVSADNGANNLTGQRRMQSKTLATPAYLTYDIYSNSGRTTAFPTSAPITLDGSGDTGGTGDGNPKTLTVYGRIPAGFHMPAPDNYLDTVVLTVTY